MRILHVMRAPVGGLFRHVLDLSAEQARRGHEVGLVVARTSDPAIERRLEACAPNLALGVNRIAISRGVAVSDLAACRFVGRLTHDLGCDIVHGHGAKGGAYARLSRAGGAAGRHRPRVFYTPHGGTLNFDRAGLQGRLYHGLERWLDPMTDGIVFESEHAARTYHAVIGAGRAARRVVHNGLQPSDCATHKPGPAAADLLFVGELRQLKGVDVLLRALHLLGAKYARPYRAVIVGAGPDAAELKRLSVELGLAARVTFPGAMPAASAFALGHVLAVPSRKESLPYVVLEAAAAGMPVIATDVGGIPEIVAGTDTGLIAAGDVTALAGAIADALDAPDSSRARAERLKASVTHRFTVGRMADDILSYYTTAERKPSATDGRSFPIPSRRPINQP